MENTMASNYLSSEQFQNPTDRLKIDSKFMQNYEVASPISSGAQILAAQNTNGDLEFFSISSDGNAYNIFPDSTSDTGWNHVQIPSPFSTTQAMGTLMAAEKLSEGNLILIRNALYANQDNLIAWGEQSNSDSRWSLINGAEINPSFLPFWKICGVACKTINHQLYVAFVIKAPYDAVNFRYLLEVGVWADPNSQYINPLTLTRYDLGVSPNLPIKMNFVDSLGGYYGSNPQIVAGVGDALHAFPVPLSQSTDLQPLTLLKPDSEIISNIPNLANNTMILDFTVTTDKQGNGALFEVLEDGNLYFAPTNTKFWQTTQLSTGIQLKQVVADLNAKGQLEAFAVSMDNKLYHIHQDPGSATGWSPFFNLGANVSQIVLGKNGDSYLEVFATGTVNNVLRHIWQDPDTTDWNDTPIEIQSNGTIEPIISYSTEITVLDNVGQPSSNQPVKIWSDDLVLLEINGGSYWVDANRPATLTSSATGQLNIIARTDSFSTPLLRIWTGDMAPGTSVVIESNLAIQNRLRAVQPEELLNAKDTQGNYLLQGSYRNQATELSKAIQQSMSLVAPTIGTTTVTPNLLGQTTQRLSMHYLDSLESFSGRIDLRAVPEQHWRVSFASGDLVFTTLERSEAESLMTEWNATLPQYGGFLGFDWGDIWKSIKEGATQLVELVVDKVSDGINAAITFVVDGIQYIYNGVISFIEEAFDVVEGLFEKVKVAFEQAFEWLGFIFDWDDIKRTAETIEHSFNEVMDFIVLAMQYLKGRVDSQLQIIETNLQSQFDRYIQSLDPNQTLNQAAQEYIKPLPAFDDNIGHNLLLNAFLNNYSQANVNSFSSLRLTSSEQTDPLQPILEKLNELVNTFETGPGKQSFDDAVKYFEQIKNSPPEQALQLTLSGLLKIVEGIALVGLTAINAVIDALFDGVAAVIQALKDQLNEDWSIPIVSELYQRITGESLTFKPIQIISLMTAIPGTAIYKALIGSAPYPTEQSVTDFKNFFTAAWLANQSGISSEAGLSSDISSVIDPPPELSMTFTVLYSVNFLIRTPVESVQNVTLLDKGSPSLASFGVFLRLMSSVFSCPWATKQNAGGFYEGNASSLENFIWVLQVGMGPIRGGCLLILKAPGDLGDATLCAWGAVHLLLVIALAIVEEVEGKLDPWKALENVLTCLIPQFLKFMRFEEVIEATEGLSLLAYGLFTAVCEPDIALIHLLRKLIPADRQLSSLLDESSQAVNLA